MERRTFLGLGGAAGAAAFGAFDGGADAQAAEGRDIYELRQYTFETGAQAEGFDAFMRDAAIPALNRLGIEPVGVFKPKEGFSPAWALLRHPDMASVATLTARLLADSAFLRDGAAFLDAPAESPAYTRVESTILLAFTGMPRLERPHANPDRVLQLRIYESPSVKTGQKKIEMFNLKEIGIFRKTGLAPVFFGECIAGAKMPNLTYMLGFENENALKTNWKTFVSDPEWKELSAMPEYADKKILSGITNHVLLPTAYSQV